MNSPGVSISGLTQRYGGICVLQDVNLEIAQGQLTCVLGPSGAGKTTLLRAIAGLEEPQTGEVCIQGRLVAAPARKIGVAVQQRDIGMVFQSYALWPHLDVFENLAFPLRVRRRSIESIAEMVREMLELLRLKGLEKRLPWQLSGGQQQRVALGRALIYEPRLLLLDEPLANLDAMVREQLRGEIRDMQRRAGVTAVYVTHDQSEALEIADHVVLMDQGRVLQQGPAEELYRSPKTPFAAEFLGAVNKIPGVFHANRQTGVLELAGGLRLEGISPNGFADGEQVVAYLRPEDFDLSAAGQGSLSGGTGWKGRLKDASFRGETIRALFVSDGISLKVLASAHLLSGGPDVFCGLKPGRLNIFKKEAEHEF